MTGRKRPPTRQPADATEPVAESVALGMLFEGSADPATALHRDDSRDRDDDEEDGPAAGPPATAR